MSAEDISYESAETHEMDGPPKMGEMKRIVPLKKKMGGNLRKVQFEKSVEKTDGAGMRGRIVALGRVGVVCGIG